MSDIKINGFTGMNNMQSSFYSGKGVMQPRAVVNADVDASGKISKRQGYAHFMNLPNAHSLWACKSCMLCASDGVLYDISNGTSQAITSISGDRTRREFLSYELVEDKVYFSNCFCNGIYDYKSGVVSDWGITLPDQPVLVEIGGGLVSGTYHVTFTNIDSNGSISGNGQIASIILNSDNSGIQVLNRPSGALVWATDSNNYHFMLIGDVDAISEIPTSEPLPTFLCSPPPCFSIIHSAFGRIWGAVDDTLYYSEPYQFGLFKLSSNFFKFDSEITLIASVASGIFIGMKDRTVFLNGTEPEQMSELSAGAGSIRGTLSYANNLPELGDILGTPEKGFVDVPVWRTTEGIVAGNITGKLYNLTKHKLKMGLPSYGASMYRQNNGGFQFLTSSVLSGRTSALGGEDAVVRQILKDGKISLTTAEDRTPSETAVIGISETVSCDLIRGGVLIE